MAGVTLCTNPWSRGRIARWMPEETGQPRETVIGDHGGAVKGPEYPAIDPMGKVPALRHDGRIVTGCAAICACLADAFPLAGRAPAPADRADHCRRMFFAAGLVEQAVRNRVAGRNPDPEKKHMFGCGSSDDAAAALEEALAGRDRIAGAAFSAADVCVGAAVARGLRFGTLPDRPAFEADRDRMTARPAFRRAAALDAASAAALKKEPAT